MFFAIMNNLFNVLPVVDLIEISPSPSKKKVIDGVLKILGSMDWDTSYHNPRVTALSDHRSAKGVRKKQEVVMHLYRNPTTQHWVVDVNLVGSMQLLARITNQPKLFQEERLVKNGGYDVNHIH